MSTYIINTHGSHAVKRTIDKVKEEIKAIEIQNEHWKSCQDGSYEMALSMTNYSQLWDEYRQLLNEGTLL